MSKILIKLPDNASNPTEAKLATFIAEEGIPIFFCEPGYSYYLMPAAILRLVNHEDVTFFNVSKEALK